MSPDPMDPLDSPDLEHAAAALRAQWPVLRAWVDRVESGGDEVTGRPSALPGWTVAELVAHVGRGMDALTAVRPADPATVPQTLAEYLGGYAAGAATIAATTRTLAAEIAPDPLLHVDRMAQAAFDHLDALGGDRVVLARRGPIALTDMVVSRVVELVVHADDLVRSVPGSDPADAVEPGSLHLVAASLLRVLEERGGPRLTVVDPLAWVRVACGRVPVDAAALEAAVRTASGATVGAVDVPQLPLL